jgi:hypothetical protein
MAKIRDAVRNWKTRKGVKESGATTRQGSPNIELFAAQPWQDKCVGLGSGPMSIDIPHPLFSISVGSANWYFFT